MRLACPCGFLFLVSLLGRVAFYSSSYWFLACETFLAFFLVQLACHVGVACFFLVWSLACVACSCDCLSVRLVRRACRLLIYLCKKWPPYFAGIPLEFRVNMYMLQNMRVTFTLGSSLWATSESIECLTFRRLNVIAQRKGGATHVWLRCCSTQLNIRINVGIADSLSPPFAFVPLPLGSNG